MPISDDDKFIQNQGAEKDNTEQDSVAEIVSSSIITDGQGSNEIMPQNDEELVDLDALFDALNLVAQENADALTFSDNPSNDSGVLTVSNEALAVTGGMDDIDTTVADGIGDRILSDES